MSRMFLNTRGYTGKINEQSAVLSQDLNDRLKDYLSNDELVSELAEILSELEDGTEHTVKLNKDQYGILKDDNLMVKVDKIDPNNPKFYMWIMNDQYIYGDIDFETAAIALHGAGEGTSWYERGIVGSAVSFISGGGEDAGTDEDTIVALAGALCQIASEKGVDPQIYFDKLESVFQSKYGQSIKDFLETEFSGRGEVIALSVFRREIDPSWTRGIDFWSIIGDAVLTIGTLGGSVLVKGIRGSSAISKLAKGGSAVSKTIKGSRIGRATSKIASRIPGFKKLTALKKTEAIKTTVKQGDKIQYLRGGKLVEHEVLAVSETGVILKPVNGNQFTVGLDKFIVEADPKVATSILDNAKIPAALVTKKVADTYAASTSDSDNSDANFVEQGAELMGWYDTLQSDPRGYQTAVKESTADELASSLLDLKNGSGFFGNTTDQEELAMCLVITGLTPDGCKELQKAYSKVDDTPVYSVLDDEIGGDHGMFTKAYWTACTGEGQEYTTPIAKMRQRIAKESKK